MQAVDRLFWILYNVTMLNDNFCVCLHAVCRLPWRVGGGTQWEVLTSSCPSAKELLRGWVVGRKEGTACER